MKREEAIEILRKNMPSDKSLPVYEAIQTLIPELKESEDERIIKKLQEYVKNRNWNLNGPSQAEVLAWLEKQKEQKKDYKKLYEDIANSEWFKKSYVGKSLGEEQKPAEWSEDIIRKAVKEVGLTQRQIDWFKTNVFPSKPARVERGG